MSTFAPVDIEAAARAVLLPTADYVATRLPVDQWPEKVIRVTATGGDSLNIIQGNPRMLVECYAPNSVDAANLARDASAALSAARDSFWMPGVFVTRVSLTWPVNFPDDDAPDHHRYQFIVTATTSLEVLP